MAKIIDGKQIAAQVKAQLKTEVEQLKEKGVVPALAVILAGDNPASQIYVKNKIKSCEEVGIKSLSFTFDSSVTEQQLIETIEALNDDKTVDGILVQLPLPKGLNEEKVLKHISDLKDVDGFSPANVGALTLGRDCFKACTPSGCMKLIHSTGVDIKGKNAVVIGRSNIVGKPMALMLLAEDATVTVCHSKTENLAEITKRADILVAAVGRDRMVKADMVKQGAIVIDVGMNRTSEGLFGDVDFESVKEVASYITPVPGGVGPMTIAMLMENTVKSAKNRLNK